MEQQIVSASQPILHWQFRKPVNLIPLSNSALELSANVSQIRILLLLPLTFWQKLWFGLLRVVKSQILFRKTWDDGLEGPYFFRTIWFLKFVREMLCLGLRWRSRLVCPC